MDDITKVVPGIVVREVSADDETAAVDYFVWWIFVIKWILKI
jgi:hypothetical protein